MTNRVLTLLWPTWVLSLASQMVPRIPPEVNPECWTRNKSCILQGVAKKIFFQGKVLVYSGSFHVDFFCLVQLFVCFSFCFVCFCFCYIFSEATHIPDIDYQGYVWEVGFGWFIIPGIECRDFYMPRWPATWAVSQFCCVNYNITLTSAFKFQNKNQFVVIGSNWISVSFKSNWHFDRIKSLHLRTF